MGLFTFNWGIVGHDKALAALESDLQNHNLAHAYLFAGPNNIGKFTVAKRFAHILQCEKGFCGECDICKEIDKDLHADTIIMDDDFESIKIEQIRKVLEKLHMTKNSPYKVFLLQNIERLTPEAGNALLKTLEEPAEGTIFILTTSRERDVLSTILSRVRLITFERLADNDVMNLLKERYPLEDAKLLDVIANFACGQPGKALTLMENRAMYDAYKKMHDDVERFLREPNLTDQFVYIDNLVKASKDEDGQKSIKDFLEIFQLILRKYLLMHIDKGNAILPREKILLLLRYIQKSNEYLKFNVNTRLLLENMMLLI